MAAVRGDNFLAKEKYMKQISGKINEMSEKEAEMSENGAIEIELSIDLTMITNLFYLKVVAKTIREIVDMAILVEDSGLAQTMQADKQPRLEALGEALADRIAESREP